MGGLAPRLPRHEIQEVILSRGEDLIPINPFRCIVVLANLSSAEWRLLGS